MALYKKDVLVRPNSTEDFEAAMNFSINWLMNTFQDKPENKDADGNYIDYFFADVFFAPGHATNSGQTWRIYSTPCEQKYSMIPAATGRIEFMTTNLEGLQAQIDQHTQSLTEVSNELGNHESRIDALENSSTEVEATVI